MVSIWFFDKVFYFYNIKCDIIKLSHFRYLKTCSDFCKLCLIEKYFILPALRKNPSLLTLWILTLSPTNLYLLRGFLKTPNLIANNYWLTCFQCLYFVIYMIQTFAFISLLRSNSQFFIDFLNLPRLFDVQVSKKVHFSETNPNLKLNFSRNKIVSTSIENELFASLSQKILSFLI